MKLPLRFQFKIFAVSPQISVTDATGALRLYVRQKAFRLKESVAVYADEAQRELLYTIAADRVIDFNAQYRFTTAAGAVLGAVRRRGMRSLWKAHYEVVRDGQLVLRIQEENPWTKVMDGLFGEIPVVGLFAGYVFHPAYRVSRADGTPLLRLEKQPAFLEGLYRLTQLARLDPAEEELAVLSLLMMVLLERRRG